MLISKSIIRKGFTALAIANIANGLQAPSQASVDASHLHQPMIYGSNGEYNDDASHQTILDMLSNDPKLFKELFWSMTTNDIPIEMAQQHTTKPLQLVLGHHTSSSAQRPKKPSPRHPASLEISMSTIGGYPVFHTPIAIGEPAQPFRAWLSTHLNGLYVRSSKCSKRDCGRGFTYDGAKSESRKSLERRFEVTPKGWTVGGNVSTDMLHLVSVDVPDAYVGEVDDYRGDDLFYFVMEFVADGALGIAPPNAETNALSPLTVPNPLYKLVESHAIKHNVLTLTLPDSPDDQGSLQVGPPQQFQKSSIRVPFANRTEAGLAHTWHVPLDSVSLDGHPNLHIPLKSVHARLDFEPNIGLPPKAANQIYEALGAKQNDLYRGAMVDCNARENLPDLVFSVGGHAVTLTKDDYSHEQTVWGYKVCVVAILPTEGEDVAMFGTNLLRKFHVVIDIDEGELGLIDRE